jgi:putative two-component system response regulator
MNEHDTVRLLVLDDNPDDAAIVERMILSYGRMQAQTELASTTAECARRLSRRGCDVLLLDYRLAGEDGLAFLRDLNRRPGAPPVIVLTGQGDEQVAVEAIRNGAYEYFSKDRLSPETLGSAVQDVLRRFRAHEEARRADESIVFALARAVSEKDRITGDHLLRIAGYAVQLGQALALDQAELVAIRYGALLHDVGKIAVRELILRKPGPLTEDEWDEIRMHPVIGERMCASLTIAAAIAPIVRHHHERWDGGGYVDGLAGDAIPLPARIVSVADAYDAMVAGRPYQRAVPEDEAFRRLRAGAGRQWDPRIVQTFLVLLRQREEERAA